MANKVKILLNDHYVKRKMSGVGRYARQINKVLIANKFKIETNSPSDKFYNGGKICKIIRFVFLVIFENVISSLKLLINPNAIHISPAFSAPVWFGKSRSIIVFHDLAFIDYPKCYSVLEKLYFKLNLFIIKISSHNVVVPSFYVKNDLISKIGLDENKIHVISPYSDLDTTTNDNSQRGYKYLLLLSNAHPRKNIQNTIEAYSKSDYYKHNVKLLIVGTFEQKIDSSENVNIEYIKNASNSELSCLYKNAELVLLFSYSEGFGFPVVEAASFEVPTLTSDVTSLEEFVIGEKCIEVALDVSDIREKMNKYYNNKKYRDMARRTCCLINTIYTENEFNKKWVRLLNEI